MGRMHSQGFAIQEDSTQLVEDILSGWLAPSLGLFSLRAGSTDLLATIRRPRSFLLSGNKYMIEKLKIEESKVPEMCVQLYKDYGTTMAGLQIFSNANDAHVAAILRILGIEDCSERIISFESLNPTHESNVSDGRENQESNVGSGMVSDASADPPLPKSPVVCKPFENAFEEAFKIADINPQKTLFFDDRLLNLQTAKCMNLHTMLCGLCLGEYP